MCVPAPAVKAVRTQATALWPKRSQASDGICASPTHTKGNPGSDHEPHVVIRNVGYATAVDLTDDKANGCDADAWAEYLRLTRDPRVKYVICNRRMFSSYGSRAWEWRPYNGANPHDKHTHLSVLPSAVFDTGPWFPQLQPAPAPVLAEEDDMPMTCTVPWAARQPDGRVPFLEVIPVKGANEALVISYNGAPLSPPWDDKRAGDDLLFGYSMRRVTSLTGPATGIDVAPDGRSVVVLCRGGGTYDVARKP